MRQQDLAAFGVGVRIGQVCGEQDIVETNSRAEEQRAVRAEVKNPFRQKPGSQMIQSLLAHSARLDVAEGVEYAKRIVVLENQDLAVRMERLATNGVFAGLGLQPTRPRGYFKRLPESRAPE